MRQLALLKGWGFVSKSECVCTHPSCLIKDLEPLSEIIIITGNFFFALYLHLNMPYSEAQSPDTEKEHETHRGSLSAQ